MHFARLFRQTLSRLHHALAEARACGAGHLVVVEYGNHRVQVLNYADGSHVRTIENSL